MHITTFRNFELAKREALRYVAAAKKHPGLKGVRYSVHHFNGQYAVIRTRTSDLILSIYGNPIYIARV